MGRAERPDHEQFMHVSMSCINAGAAGRGMHKRRRAKMRHVWELRLAPTPRHAMPCLQPPIASKATSSRPGQATPIAREGPTQPSQLSAAPRPRSCSHARRRRMTCAASASCDDRWSYLASCDMSAIRAPEACIIINNKGSRVTVYD